MFRQRAPEYQPTEWELQEAARRNCSVRSFWAQMHAEGEICREEHRRLMSDEEGDV